MGRTLPLRSRVLLGAILWTVGLFLVTSAVATVLIFEVPRAPRIFHALFAHTVLAAAVALVCMIAGLWQVRKGLSTFAHLRGRLAAVRDARARHVEGAYPSEVQPLVDDLNALLDQREQTIRRAQAKAGDLAHGLKTPLALLSQEADRARGAGHSELASTIAQQVDRMRRQIDYHLAQARAVASGATSGARCAIVDSADGLARTLQRLYAERRISIDTHVAPEHAVRVQREDLDEMLGNVMDNACKWTRSRIEVRSRSTDGFITITIDDDGPGVAAAMREQVLKRGVRADEAAPGSGFGLAIVRDLAELYGGSIALDTSPIGGARACLRLPAC